MRKILDWGIILLILVLVNGGLLYLCKADGTKVGQEESEQSESGQSESEQNEDGQGGVSEGGNPNVRVLLKTDGYHNLYHSKVTVSAGDGLVIRYGDQTEETENEDELTIEPDDSWFADGVIHISNRGNGKVKVSSLNRGYGHPSYAGTLDLYTTTEGMVIVNELPLETYLCGVVPSEMPSSYEEEALKAQAVCARSFAYRHLDSYAYEEYEAHMDDSTSFQVYGNSKPAKTAKEAVKETEGQMIWYEDSIIQAYYYSTSCGKTASAAVWGSKMQKKCPYLKSVAVSDGKEDYEKDLPWYQWSATISSDLLSNLLSQYAGKDLGTLKSVKVTKRDEGGAAITLKVKGSGGNLTVKTENKIRRALGGSGYEIRKNDGTSTDSSELLPSAFFEIEKDGSNYRITGGGFGHGIGMSQNGANEMAKAGMDYKEILTFFYSGVEVRGKN